MGASLYLRELFGREEGAPPPVDLGLERKTGDFVRSLIRAGEAKVVHDLSDGGLACAAAELALASGVGVTLNATSHAHAHFYLFGEDQGRYLIATAKPEPLIAKAHAAGVHASIAAVAGGDRFASEAGLFDLPLATLRAAHEDWMPGFMG
jgi:phosphoribosylformylglycinamidine synthase